MKNQITLPPVCPFGDETDGASFTNHAGSFLHVWQISDVPKMYLRVHTNRTGYGAYFVAERGRMDADLYAGYACWAEPCDAECIPALKRMGLHLFAKAVEANQED